MKIGDKVSVIDDNLSGSVKSFDAETVIFQDDFGFMHQYQLGQVIVRNDSWTDKLGHHAEAADSKAKSKKHHKKIFTLDLHIDKLTNNYQNYSSFERISLQQDKILEALEICKNSGIKKLEIIHGIGDGTLQNVVRELLEAKGLEFYDNALFQNQSGSVTVFLK